MRHCPSYSDRITIIAHRARYIGNAGCLRGRGNLRWNSLRCVRPSPGQLGPGILRGFNENRVSCLFDCKSIARQHVGRRISMDVPPAPSPILFLSLSDFLRDSPYSSRRYYPTRIRHLILLCRACRYIFCATIINARLCNRAGLVDGNIVNVRDETRVALPSDIDYSSSGILIS